MANSISILSEADNISGAADDLWRRTEQQAAKPEDFAASLTQLTASVAATADGAGQAREVVTTSRDNAQQSGAVVREAVDAMNEISGSSEEISRITSFIDDIAFQTKLLALNAGVGAARAGDALVAIVASIGGIAEHVTAIAGSAREQSTGIDEINIAKSQLDQPTQQNVAMFAETTAATHTLRSQASSLLAD